jgi:protein involved in polysaccharide export with SLBB domain
MTAKSMGISCLKVALLLTCSAILVTFHPAVAAPIPPITPDPGAAVPGAMPGIAPQDTLSITFVNFPTLSIPQAVVPSNGSITLPLVGEVSVAGKTTTQVTQQLTTKFSDYLVKPIITVSIVLRHPETISVGGEVQHAGVVNFVPGTRLVDAVIQAGGPLPDADMSKVSVVHLFGDKQTVDISKPAEASGTATDLVLKEGDTVYVPLSTQEVSVVGYVKTPGSYPYHADMKVLDAIGLAGGTVDASDLRNSTLTSGSQTSPLDLQKIIQQGYVAGNVVLHPGDTITVPLVSRNYIFGAVNHPGFYAYEPNDRILDALNGAGGASADGDISRIRVIHIAADKNSAQSTEVDMIRFFKKGDSKENIQVASGDVVYVPDKKKPFDPSMIFDAMDTVNLLNVGASIANRGLGH